MSEQSRQDILADYDRLIEETVSSDVLRDWAKTYAKGQFDRIRWDVDFISEQKPSNIINMGGAPYFFEFLLKRTAPSIAITSVDLDPGRFSQFIEKLGIRAIKEDFEKNPVEIDGTFDIVVFNEVFEHCRFDLIATMDHLKRLISSAGKIMITTPNGTSLGGIRRFWNRRTGPGLFNEWNKLNVIGHMGHVREYSAPELTDFFEDCGLNVDRLIYRGDPRPQQAIRERIYKAIENAIPRLRYNLVYLLSAKA